MWFTPNLVVGLTIAILGLTLLLDSLNVVESWTIVQYWPVMVILFGAAVVARAIRGPEPAGGPTEQPIVSPPLVLFIVIISIVATARSGRSWWERRESASVTQATDYVSMQALMAGNRHVSRSTQFKGANMTSVMGGTHLDLRQATPSPGTTPVVDVFALMGGVDLFVPREWNVEVQVTPVMGGVHDQRFPRPSRAERRRDRDRDKDDDKDLPAEAEKAATETPAEAPSNAVEQESGAPKEGAPRLIVRGFIIMGGLNIKP
jgi:hypothetical protein